jgi:hypothetical protein
LIRRNLLDLNVLIALTEPDHIHHGKTQKWFDSSSNQSLGICPLTEAGFVRITTSTSFQPAPHSLEQAIGILQVLKGHVAYSYWEIRESWVSLTAPFSARISGHQQITDAYLLGLAIKESGALVTFDKAIKYMAGPQFADNLLILE